jgi:3-deoxy-D-manno-octulosonic-acid transferase
MKKIILTVGQILIAGTSLSLASGGNVVIEDVINMTTVSGSTISNSSVGMKIKASNGTIKVKNNTNINNIRNSTIQNSSIGIVGEGGTNVEVKNNINLTNINNSNINGVNIGIGNKIKDENEESSVDDNLLLD